MSPAKTDEPIEMPFGLRTWVDQKNHVLHSGPDHSWEGAILRGKRRPTVNYRDTMAICATTAEPTEMPFGLWTPVLDKPRESLLHGVQIHPW